MRRIYVIAWWGYASICAAWLLYMSLCLVAWFADESGPWPFAAIAGVCVSRHFELNRPRDWIPVARVRHT